jgi:hypothetical protein
MRGSCLVRELQMALLCSLIFLCGRYTPYVGPGLLHRLLNSKVSRGMVVAPRTTPNLDDQGLQFAWLLRFGLYGMGGSTRS